MEKYGAATKTVSASISILPELAQVRTAPYIFRHRGLFAAAAVAGAVRRIAGHFFSSVKPGKSGAKRFFTEKNGKRG